MMDIMRIITLTCYRILPSFLQKALYGALCGLYFSLLTFSAVAQQPLRLEFTEGQIAAIPVAIADFTGPNGAPSEVGRHIAQIISNDLVGSGLFKAVHTASFIAPPSSPALRPDFDDWQELGVQGLLVGSAYMDNHKMLHVEFRLWDVVAERTITEGGGSADEAGMRRISHQIADFVYEEFTGDTAYFDTQIVYISESGPLNKRVKRLAIMDHDGANHRFLTTGDDLVLTPRFSPTAHEIAYLNYFNDEPSVYLLDVASGRTEKLGTFPGMSFAPRFGPNGNKLIMSLAEGGRTDIFEMDLRTQKLTRLTRSASIDTSPSYSPDGQYVVFNSDRGGAQQLYVMRADGRQVQRISYGEGRYATPVWSPRGDLIAFTKIHRGEFFIGVMRKDGSGERLLARGFLVEGPSWAPNGRVLMYFKQQPIRANGGGETHLYRIDITGFNERRLITPADASDPAWSSLLQ